MVQIEIDDGSIDEMEQFEQDLNEAVEQIDVVELRVAEEVANTVASNIQSQIISQGLRWRHDLYDAFEGVRESSNIRRESTSEGTSIVIDLTHLTNSRGINYAAALEDMKSHAVRITQDKPDLYEWAEDKGIPEGRVIEVSAKPFIGPGLRNARRELEATFGTGVNVPGADVFENIFG